MHHRNASFLFCFAAVMVLCCLSGDLAQAQTTKQPDDNQTLQSLLSEVRLLRQTLQRAGLNTYRGQLIVERTRAENEQVTRLTSMLGDARDEIERLERNIPTMTERTKLIDHLTEQEIDASKRAEMEFESKQRKLDVEAAKKRLEQQRDVETKLAAQLVTEQNKLAELESRLDALEREIDNEIQRQRTEDTSPEGKKRP